MGNPEGADRRLGRWERVAAVVVALTLALSAAYLVLWPGRSLQVERSVQRTPKGRTESAKTTTTHRNHNEVILLLGGAAAVLFFWGVNGSRLSKLTVGDVSAETVPYGASDADRKNLEREEPAPEASKLAPDAEWERTGDLFWLGNDLMWATDVLQRQGSPSEIWMSLAQSLHHARKLELEGDTVKKLAELEDTAANYKGSHDYWTPEQRRSVSTRIRDIANAVGGIAAAKQGDEFEPWDEGVRRYLNK